MTDQNYTHISILLDRSGSMQSIKGDTEGGLNSFIEAQKKFPGKATISFSQFDNSCETVWRMKDLSEATKIELMPRGSTALLDAIGKSIGETGSDLSALAEDARPAKVLFVIITDGEENSSREYSKSLIADYIKTQTDVYKWEFVFLGANQDAISEAGGIGIKAASSMTYGTNKDAIGNAYVSLASVTSAFRGNIGAVAFSDVDRAKAI